MKRLFQSLFSLVLALTLVHQNANSQVRPRAELSVETAQPAEAIDETDTKKPLKALLVTGGCCHDYPRQAEILREGMEPRIGKIDWTVVNYGDQRTGDLEIYAKENWAEGYDFVVHNECYGGVTDPKIISNIVNGHRTTGIPGVAVHCSMHSYRDAENAELWRAFLGVTSKFHEKQKRSLPVVKTDVDHPATQRLPAQWQTPNGELYIILKTWPTATVLATAKSIEYDSDQPVVWVNEYEGVKLFATSLGHHNETMESKEWLDMTADGIKWALKK
jgi:type 1 glutamine amidotransferase